MAGRAGTGKTLLGLQFLVAGTRQYGEPGVLVTFDLGPTGVVTGSDMSDPARLRPGLDLGPVAVGDGRPAQAG